MVQISTPWVTPNRGIGPPVRRFLSNYFDLLLLLLSILLRRCMCVAGRVNSYDVVLTIWSTDTRVMAALAQWTNVGMIDNSVNEMEVHIQQTNDRLQCIRQVWINDCRLNVSLLRGVYSDTTQNWTQLTQLNIVQPSQSCFCLWRHDLQTESTVVHAVDIQGLRRVFTFVSTRVS